MKMNKEKMEKDEITDEHVDRVSVSNKPKLSRKEIKKATNKERKIRNATGKRNADKQKCDIFCSNDMCEPSNTLLQRSCLDKSIENAIDKGCQLSKGFAVKDNHDNTDECFTGNTREDAKIRNCDKNQSTTSTSKSPKKSAHGGNNNENQEDISKISEFKIGEPDITEHTSKQSNDRHEQVVCSTKKPYVDYTFPTNDEYERNLRDSVSTAHNLKRKGHNKSLASGEKNDIEVKSAQAAGCCASKKESAYETLSMLDKLTKCVFDVAKPVLQERLSNLLSVENRNEFGKFLINNIEYFYHQKKNQFELTCKCIITGTSCKILTNVKNNKKQGHLNETVFSNLYKRRNTKKCKNQHDKECLCVYESNKDDITNLDFSDLQFLILDCDRNITIDQKRSLMTLVKSIRNDVVCHRNKTLTDKEEKGVWEVLKETILCLCNPLTRNSIAMHIQFIDELKTVKVVDLEVLQKQYANLKLEHDTEVEKQHGINEEQEKKNKDNTTKMGELLEKIGELNVVISLMKKCEPAEEAKSRIDVKVESSSILNEEKAVNELNQDDDSDDHGLHIESIKRNCLLLELKASPEIFENETTLKHAIMSLVKRIAKAGDIDTSISSTINVKVVFNEPLKKAEEDVIRRMLSLSVQEKKHEKALHGFENEDQIEGVTGLFSKELNDDNDDKQLSTAMSSSTVRKIFTEPESNSQQGKSEAVTKQLCQACAEKDKQIKAYEEKTQEHDKTIEVYTFLGENLEIQSYLSRPRYLTKRPCQLCEEKDKQIQAYETKIKQHQNITEKKELQETSDGIPPGTIEPLSNPFCQSCEDKEKRIKSLKKQHQKELQKCQHNLDMLRLQEENNKLKNVVKGLQTKNSELKHTTRGLTEENSKLKHDVEGIKEENSTLKGLKEEIIGLKGNSYPKAEGQKGLAVIVHSNIASVKNVQEFFEEIGFVVQCIDKNSFHLPYRQVPDGNFYCVFLVLIVHVELDCTYIIRHILRKPGQPLIVMTDSTLSPSIFRETTEKTDMLTIMPFGPFTGGQPPLVMTASTLSPSIFRETTEETDMLTMMPFNPFTGGQHRKPDLIPVENNILADFMKVTRSNRFTDILDILTRMNELYDHPVITFTSTLRKKFSFL